MADAEREDRTEAASARRLDQARAEGQVPISSELNAAAVLGAMVAVMLLAGPDSLARLRVGLALLLAQCGRLDGPAALEAGLRAAALVMLRAMLVPCGAAVAVAAAATLLQTGALIRPAALMPELGRLDPRRGLKRLFSLHGLGNAGRAALKALAISVALRMQLRGSLDLSRLATLHDAPWLAERLAERAGAVLMTVAGVQAGLGLGDVLWVRLRHLRGLRMTRHELREEAREADGSPEVKARLRRLRNQRARRRMAQAVQTATVVVTNPTHYAVALAYDRSRSAAPRVVAKGMDEMAARIRAIAAEHRVPLVANPPLARALHKVELDSEVPPEHYQAVAELIAYVWRLQGQARRPR